MLGMMDELDAALDVLRPTGPEYGAGYANHGPMASEALRALGRNDAIVSWVLTYRANLEDLRAPRQRLRDVGPREALGRLDLFPEWLDLVCGQVAEVGWQTVVGRWTPTLADGLSGAAMHGLIRTAHAVRALERQETPDRVEELSRAHAYWAARYQTLPVAGSGKGLLPSRAVTSVVSARGQVSGRLINDRLLELATFAPFSPAASLVSPVRVDRHLFLDDLIRTFADIYLANVQAGSRAAIAFIHGVTGPRAVRLLLDYVDERTVDELLVRAWQAAAGIYSVYGEPGALSTYARDDQPDPEDIVEQAIRTGDEHAIKFVEACLDEHRRNPAPLFLAAAADAAARLMP